MRLRTPLSPARPAYHPHGTFELARFGQASTQASSAFSQRALIHCVYRLPGPTPLTLTQTVPAELAEPDLVLTADQRTGRMHAFLTRWERRPFVRRASRAGPRGAGAPRQARRSTRQGAAPRSATVAWQPGIVYAARPYRPRATKLPVPPKCGPRLRLIRLTGAHKECEPPRIVVTEDPAEAADELLGYLRYTGCQA